MNKALEKEDYLYEGKKILFHVQATPIMYPTGFWD
jgi:hypothetical protein